MINQQQLTHKTVLLTGATGFLGAHIAEVLLTQHGCKLIALKRDSSDTWRCREFIHQIKWISLDDVDWQQQVSAQAVEVIIHSAWGGVAAGDRLAWSAQLSNLNLLLQLLELGKSIGIKQFIGLGSQAEYGAFSGIINEDEPANPNTAYGAVKLMAGNLVRSYCDAAGISWYWLRLFPLFGEKEDENWLLPSVIKSIYQGKPMDLTPGLQRYAYLYVADFARLVAAIVNSIDAASGVYNVSSGNAITLRYLVEKIRDSVDAGVPLNFGALPYRSYQAMHLQGDMAKFEKAFGPVVETSFEQNIANTIAHFIKKFKSDEQ